MRQTRCGDNFVGGIGREVQRSKVQEDLARNGPNLYSVYRGRKSGMVQAVLDAPELMQLRELPENNG